jgi:GH15 family glucan-1,4-alpha-glucosidase
MQILYRVNGSTEAAEHELDHLSGYRSSRPVRVGNAAVRQMQLDVYGDVLDSVWRYHRDGHCIDRRTGKDVAEIADFVCDTWRRQDSGIWEVRDETHDFIHSKAMGWVALDRACRLAEDGVIPDRRERWRSEAAEIRVFVEEHGFDEERQTYVRAPSLRVLDASLLALAIFGYHEPDDPRLAGTIDAVKRDLAEGPLVYRYRGGEEGAFLACSFWLVNALARIGRLGEAEELMNELCALANDVGLYAEEIRAGDNAFLGNFPQALVHLAQANAAMSYARAAERS